MDQIPLQSASRPSPPKIKLSTHSPEKKRPSLENLVATLHLRANDANVDASLSKFCSSKDLSVPTNTLAVDSIPHDVNKLVEDPYIEEQHVSLCKTTSSSELIPLPNGYANTSQHSSPEKTKYHENCVDSILSEPSSQRNALKISSSSSENSTNGDDIHVAPDKSSATMFLDSESSQDEIDVNVSNAVASILPKLDKSKENKILNGVHHPSIEFRNDEPMLTFSASFAELSSGVKNENCANLRNNVTSAELQHASLLRDNNISIELSCKGEENVTEICQNDAPDKPVCVMNPDVVCEINTDLHKSETIISKFSDAIVQDMEKIDFIDKTLMKGIIPVNGVIEPKKCDTKMDEKLSPDGELKVNCIYGEEIHESIINTNNNEHRNKSQETKTLSDKINGIDMEEFSFYSQLFATASELSEAKCLETLVQNGSPIMTCDIHKHSWSENSIYEKESWSKLLSCSTSLCNISYRRSSKEQCPICFLDTGNISAHFLQNHSCLCFVPVVETRTFMHHVSERSMEINELYNESSYGSPIYLCQSCEYISKSIGDTRLHLDIHDTVYTVYIGNEDCRCHLTQNLFLSPINVITHLLSSSLPCPCCTLRVSCSETLELHKKVVHCHTSEAGSVDSVEPVHQHVVAKDQTCYSWNALENYTNFLDAKLFRLYSKGSDKYSSVYDENVVFPKQVIPDLIEVPSTYYISPSSEMDKYLHTKFRWKTSGTKLDEYVGTAFDCAVQIKLQEHYFAKKPRRSKSYRNPPAILSALNLNQIRPSVVKNEKKNCRRSKRISKVPETVEEEQCENNQELSRTRSGMKSEELNEIINPAVEVPISKNFNESSKMILSGEWTNSFTYVCCSCGLFYENLADIMDHKWEGHPMVWCAHTMYRGSSVPEQFCQQYYPTPNISLQTDSQQTNSNKKIQKHEEYFQCSSCKIDLPNREELWLHIVECGGLNKIISHKKRSRRGSKFRRRTGQGVPTQRYLNLNGTPNKSTSTGGSGISTPQKDLPLTTSSTIMGAKRKLELGVNSVVSRSVHLKLRGDKCRKLPRCGFKKRFRMKLRQQKVSEFTNHSTNMTEEKNKKPVKVHGRKSIVENHSKSPKKQLLKSKSYFVKKQLANSKSTLQKISKKLSGVSKKSVTVKTKKVPVKISKKVSFNESDSDSMDDVPLLTLVKKLKSATSQPTRRKAFVKSCKITSKNLASERRSSVDGLEPIIPIHDSVQSPPNEPKHSKNIKKTLWKAIKRPIDQIDQDSSNLQNKMSKKRKSHSDQPKHSKSEKYEKKSRKILPNGVFRSKKKSKKSNEKTVEQLYVSKDCNDSDDLKSIEKVMQPAESSQILSNGIETSDVSTELQGPKKRVSRKLRKTGDKIIKTSRSNRKIGVSNMRKKNQMRKNSSKSLAVSTLDKTDGDDVPHNHIKGVRVLSYKSLNTDADKMNPSDDVVEKSLVKPKKRLCAKGKRKYCESDENSPTDTKVKSKKKRVLSRKSIDIQGFLCVECGLTFDSVTSREDHKLDCNNIALEMSLMDDSLYECPYCQLTFAMKGTQKKHSSSCRVAKKVRRPTKEPRSKRKKSDSANIESVPGDIANPVNSPGIDDIADRFKTLCMEKLGAPEVCSILFSCSMSTSDLRLNLGDSSIVESSTLIWLKSGGERLNPTKGNYPILKMLLEQPVCSGLAETLYDVMLRIKANSYLHTRDLEPCEGRLPPLVVDVSRPELLKALSCIEDFIKEAETFEMSVKKEQMLESMRRVFEDDTVS